MANANARTETETDVAHVAAAIGDPSRAKVLLALAGGDALPASALAAEAGVANSTLSGHLAKLREARLVTVELDGRYRYYRLATTDVARALEQLAAIARPLPPPSSLNAGTRARALLRARLCYDHLAGRLGVALLDALQERGVLTGSAGRQPEPPTTPEAESCANSSYRLTPYGHGELNAFGVDLTGLAGVSGLSTHHAAVRYCLDWAEQRHHLAGPLGAALTARLLALNWLRHGTYRRVVHVTDAGREGLERTFGLPADTVG